LFTTFASALTITVVTEDYPPYNYTEGGKITGASTEIVEATLKIAGISYTLKSYPWARTYKMAQTKKNVLIYSIGRSKKRENMFKWVDIIAPYDIFLFKLKSRGDVTVNSLDDAKKYEIGGVRDDVRTQHLQGLGFKLQIVDTDLLNLKKLNQKRIDLFPIDILACVYLLKKNKFDPKNYEKTIKVEELSSGLYMAFSKQTDDATVKKFKKALDELKSSGEFKKIEDKYMK
jgi:polar amino acid transport system substrate-binding protein